MPSAPPSVRCPKFDWQLVVATLRVQQANSPPWLSTSRWVLCSHRCQRALAAIDANGLAPARGSVSDSLKSVRRFVGTGGVNCGVPEQLLRERSGGRFDSMPRSYKEAWAGSNKNAPARMTAAKMVLPPALSFIPTCTCTIKESFRTHVMHTLICFGEGSPASKTPSLGARPLSCWRVANSRKCSIFMVSDCGIP